MNRRRFIVLLAASALVLPSPEVEAGKASKALARKAWTRLFSRDAARDAATKARPLAKSKKVWRYTTKKNAREAAKKGLPANRHMTSGVTPGRPPKAGSAQTRYGLPNKPEVRMTIELPARQPVRRNKVLGGAAGFGEVTSPKAVQPSAIKRITPLGN
jgi:hypothetical protein